jgi:hypothetical protein
MAADLSLQFGLEGELYAFGLSGEGYRDRVPDAALALGLSEDGGRSFAPRALLGESVDAPDGSFFVSDKPWMAIDRGAGSPFRGSLYFAWTRIRVKKLVDGYELDRELVFSFTRHSGQRPSDPIAIARSGGGAQIAVGPDGALDLVWVEEEEERSPRVVHAVSRDGGRSFSRPSTLETLEERSESLDLPSLTSDAKGTLVACWPRGALESAKDTSVRCSVRETGSGWTAPTPLSTKDGATGFPALASTGNAFWLLAYHAREATLGVALHCSRDGRRFERVATLAESPLPAERFCARPGLPCRKDVDAFLPGDYVGLAASSRRLAAAYVLPFDRAVVSVVELSEAVCSVAEVRSRSN